jgi:hypothetical protein
MRASLRASASIAALAPLRRVQAQSFAISKIMSTQWRKVDGRWRSSPRFIQRLSEKLASLKIK